MPQLIDLGRIRLQFLGEYAGATTYKVNDVVRFGGNLYVYKNATNTAGTVPTTTTHWSLMLRGFNFRGQWSEASSYIIGDVVNYGGLLYNAIGHSEGVEPDDDDELWEKFLEGFSFEGDWNSTTEYQEGDIVKLGGRVYIAKIDSTGIKPGNTGSAEEWEVFVDGARQFASWVSTDEYYINDVVTIGGIEYKATANAAAGTDPAAGGPGNPWSVLRSGLKFVGNWTADTVLEKNVLVRYGSSTYIVNQRHTSGQFDADYASEKLSEFGEGIAWKGVWASGTQYKVNDLVQDGITTYIATASHTGGSTFLGDSAYWDVFALGADYLPAQASNADKILTTNGTDPQWTNLLKVNSVGTHQIGANVNTLINGDGVADAEITNAALAVQYDDGQTDKESYAQIAFRHKDPSSSTDFIAYSADGNDDHGWLSLGVTGKDFGDPMFTLTGGNTAYLFYEAEANAAALGGSGNLVLATGDKGTGNKIIFAAGGFASGTEQMTITPDENVHIEIDTESTNPTTGAFTVVGGVGVTGDINVAGDLSVEGDINLTGLEFLAVGNGAAGFATTLTNPIAVFQTDVDDYAQIAFRNIGTQGNSSTDFLAYADVGTDNAGWIDMGITSENFDDPEFTITGAHDGYIFMDAPVGTDGAGNLVLATGSNGTENKIIFGAGGLSDNSIQMTIVPDQNVHIEIATESTSPSTGALTVVGGVGVQGNLNVAGNTEITGNVNIQGVITVAGTGTTFETNNLAVSDPMIFVASPNSANSLDFALVGEAAFPITPIVRNLSTRAVASNVATIETSAAHTFQEGDFVTIAGSIAALNGTHLITGTPDATTFTFAIETANFASTGTTGTATVSARAKYSGLTKDATDGRWKLFKDLDVKPTQVIDFNDAVLDTLEIDKGYAAEIYASSKIQVDGSDVIAQSIANAKGDLIVGTANDAVSILSVGSNNAFVQADSSTATGLRYTNLATGSVLGALLTNTAADTAATISALSSAATGQATYSTSSKYLSFKTTTGVHEVGPVFLGFSINYQTGELTATTGTDETYDCGTFVEETLLPSSMAVSVTSAGILQLA